MSIIGKKTDILYCDHFKILLPKHKLTDAEVDLALIVKSINNNEIEMKFGEISSSNSNNLSLSGTLDVTGDTSVSTFDSSGATSLATGGGVVNIASTGVMTTVKGTLNVDEAVTLSSISPGTPSDSILYLDSSSNVKKATLTNVCFLKGTKITMSDKTQKNIEDLTLQDIVLTYNIFYLSNNTNKDSISKWSANNIKGNYSTSKIRNLWVNPTESYLVINNKLKVTKQHLIFFKRNSKYYFNYAEKLLLNDELFTDNNIYEKITSIEEIKEKINVYNFEIYKDFTYFAENYLVHHYCDLCSGYSNII